MLPAILKQINALAKASKNLNELDIKSDFFEKELKTLINIYGEVKKLVAEMKTFLAIKYKDVHETAEKFASQGSEILAKLREQIDSAEDLVAAEFWPMASYQKLLTAF
jgi:glutamine synthetase type III